jgi:hypothetical protein
VDPAEQVLAGIAAAPYRHEVTVRIRATAEEVRARLPAVITAGPAGWVRADLHVQDLDWLPGVLASLDRPFAVERPDELRDLVTAFADRLMTSARRRSA